MKTSISPKLEVTILSYDSTLLGYVFWHLSPYAFYYITVAGVPYDFNILKKVGHGPLVSFETTWVSHDLNLEK